MPDGFSRNGAEYAVARMTRPDNSLNKSGKKPKAVLLGDQVGPDNFHSAVQGRIERARPITDAWARRSDKFLGELDAVELERLAFRRGKAIVAALPATLTLGLTRQEVRNISNALGKAHVNRARRLRDAQRRELLGGVR